jgi:hypothetical protein
MDAPDDAWAVGDWSPIEHNAPSYELLEHWNGAKWTLVPGPRSRGHVTDVNLTAVAAISPTAAWAIGYGTAGDRQVTVFMGWDGTRWRYLPSPGGQVGGLAAVSAHDIWVVGQGPNLRPVAERWNGSKWTTLLAPSSYKGRKNNIGLSAIGGPSSRNIWAVGHYQSGPISIDISPLVEHWDGARWQLQPSPNPTGPKGETGLDAISALSRTSAFAVASAWGSHGSMALMERWNGVRWTVIPSRLRPGVTDPELSGVAAVNPRYAWAVGQAVKQNDRHITLIEKWDGTTLQQVQSWNS